MPFSLLWDEISFSKFWISTKRVFSTSFTAMEKNKAWASYQLLILGIEFLVISGIVEP
jgi:hypothetical protein